MRKLALFSGAFALGIFAAQYVLAVAVQLPLCLAFALAAAAAFLLPKAKRLRVVLICAGLCLAMGYNFLYTQAVQQPMLALDGSDVSDDGEVHSLLDVWRDQDGNTGLAARHDIGVVAVDG